LDHVLVSVYGIFVIETKNMKGWIFGSKDNERWTQTFGNKKYSFQNPLRQNYRHTKCLSEYLGLDHRLFHSVVWFIGECTFKTEMPPNVLASGLTSYIKEFTGCCLTEGQVTDIEHRLRELNDSPVATRSEHVHSLARAMNRQPTVRGVVGTQAEDRDERTTSGTGVPGVLAISRLPLYQGYC